MHRHGLQSFLLLLLISSAFALTLTFPQSSLPQGESVTVHWGLDGARPPLLFQVRLREIEPTDRIIDVQTVANDLLGGDVTFDTGILEPGKYVAEAGADDSDPASLASSSTLTVVGPSPSVTAGPTSNGPTSSTITTTSSSVSNPNSKPTSVSGSMSIPSSSTHASVSSVATTNTTKPAAFPTSSSSSDQPQSSSSSSIDSDPTNPPVSASSSNKHFNPLPVILAVVLGLVVVGIIVFFVRYQRRRRFLLNTAPEPESSFEHAPRNSMSQSSPVKGWQPDKKVPLKVYALAAPAASGTSSASHLKPSSDHPPEETSTDNAISPVTPAPIPVLTSPTSFVPSAAAHERLLEEVQWWRSQFASSWDARTAGEDTGGAGAPPIYPGVV